MNDKDHVEREQQIRSFVISYLKKKSDLPEDEQIDTLNYLDEGYIDSLGVMRFAFELEETFAVELSPEDLTSEEFRTIGGVIKLVANKLS